MNSAESATRKAMAYRLVPIEYAKSGPDAESYVVADTGGQVIPIAGKTKEVEGGWRVEVYSTDGRASMPFPIGAVFPVDNRISNSEIDRQIHQFDLKERPEFESAGGDGPGWELGKATGDTFTKR
jgi:hypothetical protein